MGTKQNYRAGFVAVGGSPNVGKSTLLNRIVGSKLSIVTPKPQTTRNTTRGILTTDRAQIVFLDTAGIYCPKDKLGNYMVDAAKKAFQDADIIYLMVESSALPDSETDLIMQVKESNKATFLIINKVDLVKRDVLLPLIDKYRNIMEFDEVVPVSALKGDNVAKLIDLTIAGLPESPAYFPEDIVSDKIEREFISEFIREKVYFNTMKEIPYSSAVVIEDMTERKGGGAYIAASIYVEKDSQKGILVGKGGNKIKKIGQDARYEIEKFLGYSVYLDLKVKVEKNWRTSDKSLKKLGYR